MFRAMAEKQKISPTHTYVFDDSDLEQFDELSLSCVMEAVSESRIEQAVEQTDSDSESEVPAAPEAPAPGDELTLEDD